MPALVDAAAEVSYRLESYMRFVLVAGTGVEALHGAVRDAFVLGFASMIGQPSATDRRDGRLVWDVKPRQGTLHTRLRFSEHCDEANLHTDSQYLPEPERYMSLWCLVRAASGGATGLVDGRAAVEALATNPGGAEVVETLRRSELPFQVPTSFTSSVSDAEIDVVRAPILADVPFIRYRHDTLIDALKNTGDHVCEKTKRSLEALELALLRPEMLLSRVLAPGEALFVNNHEILHSRTAFRDSRRHLLRVRMRGRELTI